jgi:hypothetical protein
MMIVRLSFLLMSLPPLGLVANLHRGNGFRRRPERKRVVSRSDTPVEYTRLQLGSVLFPMGSKKCLSGVKIIRVEMVRTRRMKNSSTGGRVMVAFDDELLKNSELVRADLEELGAAN